MTLSGWAKKTIVVINTIKAVIVLSTVATIIRVQYIHDTSVSGSNIRVNSSSSSASNTNSIA